MNNISTLLGRKEGYMEGGQSQGYVLVRGSNALFSFLELMM